MIAWGFILTMMGLVKGFGGLLTARLFLGLAEGGLYTLGPQTGDLILGFREFTSICRVGIKGKSWDSVLLFSSLLLLSAGHLGDFWLLQLEILTGWQV